MPRLTGCTAVGRNAGLHRAAVLATKQPGFQSGWLYAIWDICKNGCTVARSGTSTIWKNDWFMYGATLIIDRAVGQEGRISLRVLRRHKIEFISPATCIKSHCHAYLRRRLTFARCYSVTSAEVNVNQSVITNWPQGTCSPLVLGTVQRRVTVARPALPGYCRRYCNKFRICLSLRWPRGLKLSLSVPRSLYIWRLGSLLFVHWAPLAPPQGIGCCCWRDALLNVVRSNRSCMRCPYVHHACHLVDDNKNNISITWILAGLTRLNIWI